MPEGPSILILKEELAPFAGKKVLSATGQANIDFAKISNKTVVTFKTWGKHFLICFPRFTVRIHFMLFGSCLINERKKTVPGLQLRFTNGEVNFYASAIRIIDEPLDDIYDWTTDVMNPAWDAAKALNKLKQAPDMLVCDALLDQQIFSGVGNIIKNEVLFRIRIHPASTTGALPLKKRKELVREAVRYSFDFLHWKKAGVLKKHWQAHTKKTCPRCHIPLEKAHMGKTNRRTFYCDNCQVRYAR
ncbi:endonuclease [Chitinophaga sp. XS-30]|uniref:endonuclease n=1 Tax=Chitinophaga sp. XS-30 TaxID=2604421 RepID=UPI0011DC8AE9|nr:endonuclease [Chitinophaga sp. XS-30]QEH41317.1 endonuclease [Chitinophaga sp. XS-30]